MDVNIDLFRAILVVTKNPKFQVRKYFTVAFSVLLPLSTLATGLYHAWIAICLLEVLEVFRNAKRPPTAVLFDPQI